MAQKFLDSLPERNKTMVREHLFRLQDDPYPGSGGDKERLELTEGYTLYRILIGRRYTAFYRVFEEERIVQILDIMTIEQAHKRYGRL